MKSKLTSILSNSNLIADTETFISETDFQLNLAKMLKQEGCTNVTLECPAKIDNKNSYIDISCEYNGQKYYIELKYKTKAIKNQKYKRMGLVFCLKDHKAHTDNRYLIYKDIYRLESTLQGDSNKIGYVLFLTNDNNYEKNHDDMPLLDKQLTSKKYKHRDKNYNLKKQYLCEWQDFKCCKGFRYLLIEIK